MRKVMYKGKLLCDERCAAPLWGDMRWQALQSRLVSTGLIERVGGNKELMGGGQPSS